MIQLLVALALFLATSYAPEPQNEVLAPFMRALQEPDNCGPPPDVIPAFPNLFGDETPYRPPQVIDW